VASSRGIGLRLVMLRRLRVMPGGRHAIAERRRRLCRVRAARLAAARRTWGPFVLAPLRAAARRADLGRRRAAFLAWRESAERDTAERPSRFSAREVALERRADGLRRPRRPAREAYSALRFVFRFALAGGRDSFTPDRRAFDSPIAIACLVDRAPCFPSRTWCISSRTNSPAWVVGALPARFALRARLAVTSSGICLLRRHPTQQRCHGHARELDPKPARE
jgi:hypothetical protein